jgi:hypothetical protein
MDDRTRAELKELYAPVEGPCVSLYLPVRRGGPGQRRICWKNLTGEARDRLEARGLERRAIKRLLAPGAALLDEAAAAPDAPDGLALFLASGFARSIRLPRPPAPLARVARSFHLAPLLGQLGENGRFLVLALSKGRVRLLEGDWAGLRKLKVPGLPADMAEALSRHDTDEPLIFHTHHAVGKGGDQTMFHGHGVGVDDAKDDLLLYFRLVDRALHPRLRTERAPLVLAAVASHWPIYRAANTYAHLLPEGVAGNPDHYGGKELHDRAWAVVAPLFEEARRRSAGLFAQRAGNGRAVADLDGAVRAAHQGLVEVLFAADGPPCWGTVDPETGAVTRHEEERPGDEDLVNFAVLHAARHGGAVHVTPPGETPGGGRVAALLRLPAANRENGR